MPGASRPSMILDYNLDGFFQPRSHAVKVTRYFEAVRSRPDRAVIRDEWIERAIDVPIREEIQEDGRIRRWTMVSEMENRYLRVILLSDGETVHNAFFDRGFVP